MEKGKKERHRATVWNNGIKNEKIKIAKKMQKQNLPINIILSVTGLTKDEFDKIK